MSIRGVRIEGGLSVYYSLNISTIESRFRFPPPREGAVCPSMARPSLQPRQPRDYFSRGLIPLSSASHRSDASVSYSHRLRQKTERQLHEVSRFISGLGEIQNPRRWSAVYFNVYFYLHSLEHIVSCMLEEQTSGSALASDYWCHVSFPCDLLETVLSIQKYMPPRGVSKPLGVRLVNLWKFFDQGYARRFSDAVIRLRKYQDRRSFSGPPQFEEMIGADVRELWRGFSQASVDSLTVLVRRLQGGSEVFTPETGRFYAERINAHFIRWTNLSDQMAGIEAKEKGSILTDEDIHAYGQSRVILCRSLPEVRDILLLMAGKAQAPEDTFFQDFWSHLNGRPKIQISLLVTLICRYLRGPGLKIRE